MIEPKQEQVNSVTFDITMPSGITALLTIRDTDGDKIQSILDATMTVDKSLIIRGIKPHVRVSGGAFGAKKEKEWTGDKCPKDGARLYHITTKTGKDMCKCENSTYINGVAGGCDFVAWSKNLADAKVQKEAWKKSHTDPTDNWQSI